MQDRRVVQELELPPQLVVELLENSDPRPFIRSHLLATMITPQPAFSASPAIVGVLIGGPFRRIDHQDRDVGLFDRAAGHDAR